MKKYILFCLVITLNLLFSTSCESDTISYKAISGTIENLPPLDESYEYVAWIKDNNNVRKMGNVFPNEDGIAQFNFVPLPTTISEATEVTVTVEDTLSNNVQPSNPVVLKASFISSDEAQLNARDIADFSGISGVFILDSPTTTSSSTDNSGVWFVNEDINQGLTLPALSNGWKYEGWVMFGDVPVSTGKFKDPGLSDEGNPYSGELAPYPFPGEDFNKNAPTGTTFPMDLKNKIVSVSIEPEKYDSEKPFIAILQDTISDPSITKSNYIMNIVSDFLPSGTISKVRE